MQISNTNLKETIQITMQKKAQDIVKNEIGNILEKMAENTKAVEEAAKATGKGSNLDIQG